MLAVLVGLLAMHVLAGGHDVAAPPAGGSAAAAVHGVGDSSTEAGAASLALVSAPADDPAPHCPTCPGGESFVGVAAACVLALLLLALLLGAPPRWPGLARAVASHRGPARAAEAVAHSTVPLRVLLSISRT